MPARNPVVTNPPAEGRMDALDGFRFFAILSVILYHFYCRWSPPNYEVNRYPYQDTHDYFSYGYLGVQFFFIISGFVISYTLTRTFSLLDFWKKRLVRLLPAMAICSLVTLSFFRIFDRENLFYHAHSFINLFYSLSFINPLLIDRIFRFISLHGNYINGSYWSLWPEIQFYALASLVYFARPKKFFTNFTLVALLIYFVNRFLVNLQGSNIFGLPCSAHFVEAHKYWIIDLFNIPYFILWFLSGALFYQLFVKRQTWLTWLALLVSAIMLLLDGDHWQVRALTLLMLSVFGIFILRPSFFNFISGPFVASVGVASYSLYLIHESIGVYLIHTCAGLFGPLAVLFPLLLLGLFIGFSLLLYKYVEKPIGKYFRKRLSV